MGSVDSNWSTAVKVTAEVNATIGNRAEIVQLIASREFIQDLNASMLCDAPEARDGVNIVITGVFRLFNEQGGSLDVSELTK